MEGCIDSLVPGVSLQVQTRSFLDSNSWRALERHPQSNQTFDTPFTSQVSIRQCVGRKAHRLRLGRRLSTTSALWTSTCTHDQCERRRVCGYVHASPNLSSMSCGCLPCNVGRRAARNSLLLPHGTIHRYSAAREFIQDHHQNSWEEFISTRRGRCLEPGDMAKISVEDRADMFSVFDFVGSYLWYDAHDVEFSYPAMICQARDT